MEHGGLLARLSTGKGVLILLIILIIAIRTLATLNLARFQEMMGGVGILDAEITYTVEHAYQMLSDMGQKGREAYLRMLLTWDVVHPLSLCAFSVCAILFFFKKRSVLLKLLALVPILALGLDYAENVLIVSLLLQYPARLPITVSATSILTNLWC